MIKIITFATGSDGNLYLLQNDKTKILVECGLVNDRREGKWHYYTLNCEKLTDFKAFIDSLTCVNCGDGEKGCCL